MKENKTVIKSSGIGFLGLLTIVFITLKLCGIIEWSWLWILSPIWLGAATVVAIILVVIIVVAIVAYFENNKL